MSIATQKEIDRFSSYCVKDGDCIIWSGHKDKDGYGIITFRRGTRKAHRVALFLVGIAIPEGLVVNHSCRRRDCVNPQHLNCLSPSENSKKDSASMGYINSQKRFCKQGHPFDKFYGRQRYCSICENAKSKRLRAKWKAEGIFKI